MICIAIPRALVPENCMHTLDESVYSEGCFVRMRKNTFVPLTDELTLDSAYEDDSFFIELSGNEFVKLIERDELPNWATPELLFAHSSASGTVNPVTRKITWIRQRKNCNKAK